MELPFPAEDTEVHTGAVTCPRSHSEDKIETARDSTSV